MLRSVLTLLFLTTVYAAPVEDNAADTTEKVRRLAPGKWFDRIVVINLENTNDEDALSKPYLASFKRSGVYLSNYYAITHPSQPNYISQIYGDTGTSGNNDVSLSGKSLVDLMEAKNVTWKSYQENYPGGCFLSDSNDDLYRRKHNPFVSMSVVTRSSTLCAKNVNSRQLDTDIAANNVPQLVYYTPNMDNDGHDTGVGYASQWLESFLKPRLTKPALTTRTLFVITFDEEEDYFGDNKVYTVLYGDVVKAKAGTTDSTRYSHYSLLRTIEDNWELGTLGKKDRDARPFLLA